MRSESTEWSRGQLLVALGLLGLVVAFGFVTFQYLFGGPEEPDSRDFEFYYGETYFKRLNEDNKFTLVHLKCVANGPWLWTSETEGFQVDRKSAVETCKQIAQQLGLKEPRQWSSVVRVDDDFKWSLTLERADSREERSDGWIDAKHHDAPVAISMTKDGPRISLRCTEEELVKAFGKPTKIIRTSTVGAPGV